MCSAGDSWNVFMYMYTNNSSIEGNFHLSLFSGMVNIEHMKVHVQ